jgi:hypothetical protein
MRDDGWQEIEFTGYLNRFYISLYSASAVEKTAIHLDDPADLTYY